MKIENSFNVDLSLESAWTTLLDVPSLVPCMPGAELLAIEDERSYRGQVKVKLGPVSVAFRGRARLVEVDEAQHLVRAIASGKEEKGRGSAQAEVTFRLSPDGSGTRVNVVSDIALAGSVAQYGRAQSVIADVSQVMIDTFAQNLSRHIESTRLEASVTVPVARPAAPAPAISVFALLLALVRRWCTRFKEKRHQ
ncbi:MAG: SRPBCC family protein [Alphaproteobacteria bacterium]|nr:SRPBCC family protein [Alphaproteobacteria bacterium]